ncbi:MAG: glycoside hydrolase family 127 protein [Mariniphaga sp.]|nr:glycoside hydrolase family 127 protein [Mariniphaga sp.]
MKFILGAIFILAILSGCGLTENQATENKSEPFPADQVELAINAGFLHSPNPANNVQGLPSNNISNTEILISELTNSLNLFDQTKNSENLESCINKWQLIYSSGINYDSTFIVPWIKSSAELLSITGNTIYAEELERILAIYENSGLKQSLINSISPFIFTKDVDHIYFNLFFDSSIKYKHTLGGEAEIEQLVSNEYGTIDLKFEMVEKRYIELYIRIPSWVNKAEVEVKKVYYHAIPGEYCKIAKKWKEGDVVNIRFD